MKSWVSSAFSDESLPPMQLKKESSSRTRSQANKKNTENTIPYPNLSSKSLTNKENSNVELKIKPIAQLTDTKDLFTKSNTNNNRDNKQFKSLALKYEPVVRSDLVVHKNKIEQLSNLLDEILAKPKGSILLVEGPTGCGKYTTLKVLCKEKNVELVEWDCSSLNLKSLDFQPDLFDNNPQTFVNEHSNPAYESQQKVFSQFLFKSSRYQTNQIFKQSSQLSSSTTNKTILFVKEIPNFGFRDSKSFLNLLNEFKKFSKYSLIFSITQTTYSDLNPLKIFTSDARKDLKMLEISFNSLANTYLSKFLERVAKSENLNFVDKKFLETICLASNGDLRHAINLLELSSTQNKCQLVANFSNLKNDKLNNKKKGINSKNSKQQVEANCFDANSKDPNFNIFRGLGKILHRKNLEIGSNEEKFACENKLPKHLLKFKREPLTNDPESIYDKIPLNSDLIISYLHQNYADIFNAKSNSVEFDEKFDALISINECLIMSDIINKKCYLFENNGTGNQENRVKEISALISIRSVLFNFYFNTDQNESRSSNSRGLWMPLFKPYNSKLIELKQKRKKMAKDFLNTAIQNDSNMIKYLIEMNKEFFIEFIPFVQLKSQFKRTNSFLTNIPEYSQLFTKYKATSTKSNQQQTNENDYEGSNEDQNENVFANSKKPDENSNITQSVDGNYSYEDPSTLNIIDYNF